MKGEIRELLSALVFGPAIMDMGFGRAAVNIQYVLQGTQSFQFTADIVIGLVAGVFGLGLVVASVRRIGKW